MAALDAAYRIAPPASLPLTRDRSPFLALGYTQLGSAAKARELVSGYETRLDALGRRREAVVLNRVRGDIARVEGKTDSAIVYLRRGDAEADGLPSVNCMVCTPFLLGTVFDRAGQADSARTYFTQYVEMNGSGRTFIDRYWLAPTLFRLGELYENAGDVRHATEYYGRFVDLWKNADPELQPRVTEARGRIDRLNRANR
jgi:tetratricopeptide (TPR) repeat protein